jgi:hypothetical protein
VERSSNRIQLKGLNVIEYTIETSLRLLQVHVSGSVSLLDLVNFVTNVEKDRQYGERLNTLFIVDAEALISKLIPESLSRFFRRIEESSGSATWAVVVSDESHKSIFFAALQNFAPKRLKVRIFDDEFLALQWLKSN